MNIYSVRKGATWALGTALLSGVIYALLTLTLTVNPAYAAGCDCNEEFIEAEDYCNSIPHDGLQRFSCMPTGVGWEAWCNDGTHTGEPCPD
jgi:hypothetical protein